MTSEQNALIAVVNDDPTQRTVLTGLLAKDGYQVRDFAGAEETLKVMRESPPDLIITDLYMPDMDGWRFCRLLRSPEFPDFNQIPILIISATFSGAEVSRITAELGANAFLPTPVEAGSFLSQVRKLIKGEISQVIPTVLVIEDSRALAQMLTITFEAHGYRVRMAYSGRDGWKSVCQESPEVVCLDYHLPDMTGLRLLKEFHTINSGPAVVIMTSDPNPRLALEVTRQGARAYVRKPFDPEYLISVCDSVRHERSLLQVETLLEKRTRELRKSETRFRTIIENTGAGYFFIDLQGSFQEVNQAWLNMHGYSSPEEVIGRPFHVTQVDQDLKQAEEMVKVILSGKPNLSREFSRRKKDASVGYHTFSAQPVKDGNQVVGIEGFLIDTTEFHRIQDQLNQAQKMESVGILAGGVAHDFNNILTSIQGYAELAFMASPQGSLLYDQLKEILQASERAAHLTRQLLVFSRKQPMDSRLLNLNEIIINLSKMLQRLIGEDIIIESDLSTNLSTAMGDRGNIEQVIMNLVVNARDAMPAGGKITIKTENIHFDHIDPSQFGQVDANDFVCFSIADTGSGMDKNIREHIFDPFFTTKGSGKGTGLGLSVVYGIIKQHKGWIDLQSESGRGTVFKVYLPAASPLSEGIIMASGEERNSWENLRGKGERILVVEDDDCIRQLVEDVLSSNGYSGFTARSSEEAFECFEQDKGNFHLLLSDVVLPGKSGLELVDELLSRKPNLKVLLTSGYADRRSQWAVIQEKGYPFIPKPFQIGELLKSIKEILVEP